MCAISLWLYDSCHYREIKLHFWEICQLAIWPEIRHVTYVTGPFHSRSHLAMVSCNLPSNKRSSSLTPMRQRESTTETVFELNFGGGSLSKNCSWPIPMHHFGCLGYFRNFRFLSYTHDDHDIFLSWKYGVKYAVRVWWTQDHPHPSSRPF